MTAAKYLQAPDTEYAKKIGLERLRYEQKQKERKRSQIMVTPENEAEVGHRLTQAILAMNYAAWHNKQLVKKGFLPADDETARYAELLERKFEAFEKFLTKERQEHYRSTRMEMENLYWYLSLADAEEMNRIVKFVTKLLERRK
ncbi:hypothetical protein SAMN05443429_11250 [Cruoricaptor ignavus]|uniref:Uncharacterized protein n=1 Tax=Cruoricaptor ignavus TaxID=1118202 RepID=A0A1M6HG85_9FLAO|nr:hypothetical protein [Cruoricaptor ignavus]SHJ21134.1 hypothetical protein SAMN05443429_11250 [Cruoricaptor ignavus]